MNTTGCGSGAGFLRHSGKSTPGFFQNGREWRSWFRTPQLGPADGVNSGPLRVTLDNGKLTAGFTPTKPVNAVLFLHITGLGFDIKTEVQGGENRGKILRHDFVVLSLNAYKEQLGQQTHHWTIDYPVKMLQQKNLKALAFWVTGEKDPTPLQATGGWIE